MRLSRLLSSALAVLLLSAAAYSQTLIKVNGIVERGNLTTIVSGVTSSTKNTRTYAGALVTVLDYPSGATSTIYSTSGGGALANPFSSSSTDASFSFYAAEGHYSLRFSGGGIPTPWTVSDISIIVGISSLNGLTADTQLFATGSSGTDFNISSATATHTFNIPSASLANRGLITIGTQSFNGDKTFDDSIAITSNIAKGFVYSDANKKLATTAIPPDGGLLIGSTGNIPVVGNLAGTSPLVVTNAPGAITLSCPTCNTNSVRSEPTWFPSALCSNATPSTLFDLPVTTPAVASCFTGTNVQKGALDFADSGPFIAQKTFVLPSDWTTTGGIDAKLYWTSTAISGDAKWNISTACAAVGGTVTDDPTFNAAQVITTTVAGTTLFVNTSSQTALTLTGCTTATPLMFHVKISRDGSASGDTLGATARLIGMVIIYRRSL